MSAKFWGLAIAVLGALCAGQAASADGADPVIRAELSARCALEVDMRRDEQSACWRLDCVDAPARALGCDTTAMHQVVEVLPAPDQSAIAVMTVGEGHPMLEIVALQPWLQGQPYSAQCTFNPYPGTISVDRWDGASLLVSSDVDLNTPAEQRIDSMDVDHHYRVNPGNCALTAE